MAGLGAAYSGGDGGVIECVFDWSLGMWYAGVGGRRLIAVTPTFFFPSCFESVKCFNIIIYYIFKIWCFLSLFLIMIFNKYGVFKVW